MENKESVLVSDNNSIEFFKVGTQLIAKKCLLGVSIAKEYDSETDLATCKFLVGFIGDSINTGNTVNKRVPFFSFTACAREDEITEETITLLIYCLVAAMNREYADTKGMIFNFDTVATKIKGIYENITEERENDEVEKSE